MYQCIYISKGYTKRKQLESPISSNKLDDFVCSGDSWNAAYACRVELLEEYSFWKILENVWNRYGCGSFLKALPLSRCSRVMTLTLTDQWPGKSSNYMQMVFKNLVESFYLNKKRHLSWKGIKPFRLLSRLIYRDKICFSSNENNINKLNKQAKFSLCHCFAKTLNVHKRIL